MFRSKPTTTLQPRLLRRPEISHASSRAVAAFLDGRLLIVLFTLLFAIALLRMWAEKSDKQRRERKAAKIQTVGLLQVYATATKALTVECGYARTSTGSIPNVFTNDPGWAGWRGPYVRGDIRSSDYYGTPISFVFSNGTF